MTECEKFTNEYFFFQYSYLSVTKAINTSYNPGDLFYSPIYDQSLFTILVRVGGNGCTYSVGSILKQYSFMIAFDAVHQNP